MRTIIMAFVLLAFATPPAGAAEVKPYVTLSQCAHLGKTVNPSYTKCVRRVKVTVPAWDVLFGIPETEHP